MVIGAAGCNDAQTRPAVTADTAIEGPHPAESTQRSDSEHSHANGSDSVNADTSASPADVLRRYYDAIQHRQYDTAYALWGSSGKASGHTRAEFAHGFGETIQTNATVGDSVRVEGAAGSQYATVPVTVDAVLRDGTHQHFVGTYTLRRAMVDGATPEQRRWHIYSAHLTLKSS